MFNHPTQIALSNAEIDAASRMLNRELRQLHLELDKILAKYR